MSTNYKKLGEIVELIDERNKSLESSEVLGISIDKEFMPSVANTIGTDLSNYKLLRMNTFACNPMHVGRDERLPVSLYKKDVPAIVSPAYFMFRVKNENKVLPDFLMLIFKRDNFDRNCWFRTDGSVRGGITWNDICEIELPVPDLKEQKKIINTYNAITKRIQLKQKINENLEKTAQCLFDNLFKSSCEKIKQGEVIDNWKYKNLNTVASFTYGKMADDSIKVEKGYPIFSGYHNVGFSSEYMFELPQIVVLARGVSGTGEVKLSPEFCWLTNLSIAVLLNDRDFLFYYLFYLKNDNLRALDSGSAQSQITINNLGDHKIIIPPKKLAVGFNNKMIIINTQITKNEKEIAKLQELKQLVISKISRN